MFSFFIFFFLSGLTATDQPTFTTLSLVRSDAVSEVSAVVPIPSLVVHFQGFPVFRSLAHRLIGVGSQGVLFWLIDFFIFSNHLTLTVML